jgi:hypothetical protein
MGFLKGLSIGQRPVGVVFNLIPARTTSYGGSFRGDTPPANGVKKNSISALKPVGFFATAEAYSGVTITFPLAQELPSKKSHVAKYAGVRNGAAAWFKTRMGDPPEASAPKHNPQDIKQL